MLNILLAIKCITCIVMFVIPGIVIRNILNKRKIDKKILEINHIHNEPIDKSFISHFTEILGLSISANVIYGTILALFGIFNRISFLIYLTLIIILMIILIIRPMFDSSNPKKVHEKKTHNVTHEKLNRAVIFGKFLVILSLIVSAFLILSIHTNYSGEISQYSPQISVKSVENESYSLPFHGDEWTHIAQSKYILETGKIPFHNPYFKHQKTPDKITGILESGFNILVAEIFILFPEYLVTGYMYLPAIWIIITGLFVFYTFHNILNRVKSRDDNTSNIGNIKGSKVNIAPYLIGPIAVILIAFSRNNVNLLGYWFFVPITVAISTMIFLIGISCEKNMKKTVLVSAFLIITYAPLAIISICSMAAAHWISRNDVDKKIKSEKNKIKIPWIAISIVAIILLSVSLIILLKGLDLGKASEYILKHLIYPTEQFDSEVRYDLLSIIGIELLFAAAGLCITAYASFRKKYGQFKEYAIIISGMYIFSILNWIFYDQTGYSVLLRYQRNILLACVLSTVLVGITVYAILKAILDRVKEPYTKQPHCTRSCIAAIITAVIIMTIFAANYTSYQKTENTDRIYHIIEEKDMLFLVEVNERFGNNNIILSSPLSSIAVYPITGNKVVSIAGGNLNYGRTDIIERFSSSNCIEREKIMKKNDINYLWTTFDVRCDNFKIILQKDYNRLYEVSS